MHSLANTTAPACRHAMDKVHKHIDNATNLVYHGLYKRMTKEEPVDKTERQTELESYPR